MNTVFAIAANKSQSVASVRVVRLVVVLSAFLSGSVVSSLLGQARTNIQDAAGRLEPDAHDQFVCVAHDLLDLLGRRDVHAIYSQDMVIG